MGVSISQSLTCQTTNTPSRGAKTGDDNIGTGKHKDITSLSSEDGYSKPDITSRESQAVDPRLDTGSRRQQAGHHKPGILLMALEEEKGLATCENAICTTSPQGRLSSNLGVTLVCRAEDGEALHAFFQV